MKKRLLNKLLSENYSTTPKIRKWMWQNNIIIHGMKIDYPIIFSLDEQIKFNKKDVKRTAKKIKILCNHFKHSSDWDKIYIKINHTCTVQFDKLFLAEPSRQHLLIMQLCDFFEAA